MKPLKKLESSRFLQHDCGSWPGVLQDLRQSPFDCLRSFLLSPCHTRQEKFYVEAYIKGKTDVDLLKIRVTRTESQYADNRNKF